MGKAVAKRKLKKSFYDKNMKVKNINMMDFNLDSSSEINGLYHRRGATVKSKKEESNLKESFFDSFKRKYMIKVTLQGFTTLAIVIFVLLVKFLDISIVKKSEISKKIISEFNTNYSLNELLEVSQNFIDKAYLFIEPIIPDALSQNAIAVFNSVFSKKTSQIELYNESTIEIYNESNSKNIYEDTVVAVSSSIIENDENVLNIIKTGIEFVRPTSGTITSHFGEREKIFEGDDDFHYGTDIANIIGTPIYSSINGEVIVCSFNKYTGNYIEVKNGNVTTRYCHLSEQLVKVGQSVKKGDLIGKMGDTGLVTGPHLHFEIMYNRTRVDATKLVDLS